MDFKDIAEQAYKNGYEQAIRDFSSKIRDNFVGEIAYNYESTEKYYTVSESDITGICKTLIRSIKNDIY